MADTDLILPINHPRLAPIYSLGAVLDRSYFAVAAVSGFAMICFLAAPGGPVYACAHPGAYGVFLVFLVCLFIGGLFAQFVRWTCSKEIIANRDGLILPFFIGRINQVALWQSWINISAATIETDSKNERSLLLQLRNGSSIRLPLAGMEPQTIEKMLLSIELWGTSCTRSQDLFDLQAELHNVNKGIGQLSYTDMWNDELGHRFASTTFVPLEPGTKLQNGRLTVVKQLAFGGLSAIYLVQDGQTEMRVLKEAVVPASMEVKDLGAAEKALQREAEILSQLQHPNIVHVLDHFVESGHHYLLLDRVTGQDLRQLVRQNGIQPEEKVLDWALQIASALEYLHTWNPPIIHRDLTPENIVLKNDGTIVIIDFGASNLFLGTMTGTIVGKQAYMAPEQLQGRASLLSDIYSFGGTLQYLLTGKDPIPLSESHPSDSVNVSPELNELIGRLTRLDQSSRSNSMSLVKTELMEIFSQKGFNKLFTGKM